MLLSQIMNGVPFKCEKHIDIDIEDIVYNSRKSKKGNIFVALTGAFSDGHEYVKNAYDSGMRVFLCEKQVTLPSDATVLYTDNTRKALAVMSSNLFDHPDREVKLIGVTGTKGKTTITQMLKAVLCQCGIPTGVIGTVGAYYLDKFIPTVNTTPESYESYKIMRQMADSGCKAICIEVSSLGLKHYRVENMQFDTAVFTNLSPDHIGGHEHESFEEYAYWKKQLFHRCRFALLCADDLYSKEIIKEISCPFETFSLYEKSDYMGESLENVRTDDFFGIEFNCKAKGDSFKMKVCMPGKFSVLNALASLAVGKHLGLTYEQIGNAVQKARVKGRSEYIHVPADYTVMIDYAHNGISMKSILDSVREFDHAEIITVFGSVGDRAQIRREEMGRVSGALATMNIITTDDPNFEEPMVIAKEIASYIEKENGKYEIILDRKKAVHRALSIARENDIVLILGKGSETCQKIKGEKIPYSDYESVASYFTKEG